MRVSVPGIPQSILTGNITVSQTSAAEAIERLATFLLRGRVSVMTGAGVSVDSGIRAYRGHDGRYMNPNYKPIFYNELIDETGKGHTFRLRSYLGYPPVRDALPNPTHFALATLQHSSYISNIITQNVDGLHHKALQNPQNSIDTAKLRESILELHGSLHRVNCKYGHSVDRNTFQSWLSSANPRWHEYALLLESTGTQPRTNPDGDVAIEHLGISYTDFVVPDCPSCILENRRHNIHKPQVTFFGETIPQDIKDKSYQIVKASEKFLIIGTTLATYSAFRLLKHALELKKPVILLNMGPTRGDGLPGVDKLEILAGAVMTEVTREVLGSRAHDDLRIRNMLNSGVVNPPVTE